MQRDVIVIGDVHGDGDRLTHALQRLRLAGPGGEWTGGRTSLVMMGDVLDGRERGDESSYVSSMGDIDTVRYLDALQRSARAAGGEVTCLLGNHEQMNRIGVFDYVHRKDFERYGDAGERYAMMRGGVGATLAGWKRAYIENKTLFCHAGVHTSVCGSIRGPQDVLKGLPWIGDTELMEHRQYMTDSWTAEQLDKLRSMLERCGCRQMMIGHNSVPDITAIWRGSVVQTDACLSRAYGNSRAMHVACVRPNGEWEPVEISLREVR
jgi:Calcineurin-like phosphoesterase